MQEEEEEIRILLKWKNLQAQAQIQTQRESMITDQTIRIFLSKRKPVGEM